MQKRTGAVNSFVVIYFARYKKSSSPLQSVWRAEK